MRLLAPAKINLHLRVGPRDAAGYHPLLTWMCTVGLFDTLTIRQDEESLEPVDSSAARGIALTCDDAQLPCDATNLVHRAATALFAEAQKKSPRLSRGLRIELQKRIPAGGGLGGGSADAARTLLGLNRLWNLDLPPGRLHEMAESLGSDVPFFLHGPSGICSGRGDVVAPTNPPRARWALLLLSGFPVPTRDVYAKFDELRLGDVGFGEA